MNCWKTKGCGQVLFFLTIALSLAALMGCAGGPARPREFSRATTLPDLSGLAWVEDDLFLAVHDTKRTPEKMDWPRVSLVRLAKSKAEGPTWKPLDVKFPGPDGPSSDLESASPIPGGRGFLFAESGQEGDRARRIFFAVLKNETLSIESFVNWPVPVHNVEGTEVCQLGRQLVFLYAERAEGLSSTKIKWATLSLNPLEFGAFKEVTYQGGDPIGKGARPIAALAVDSHGMIYSASSYDPGTDDGPFRSVVWQIGRVLADTNGNPLVELGEAKRLATLDGCKVESIAIRELDKGGIQLYVGTDDENYGGIIRLLPGTSPAN
jgi:hypothetical protein